MWTYSFSKTSLKFLEQTDREAKESIKARLLELGDYLEGQIAGFG